MENRLRILILLTATRRAYSNGKTLKIAAFAVGKASLPESGTHELVAAPSRLVLTAAPAERPLVALSGRPESPVRLTLRSAAVDRRNHLREGSPHQPQRCFLYSQFSRSSHERQRQHHLQRIGAHLSRSTRRRCVRCHDRRTRLDGAIHRRRPCTAQDSRERGGPGSDEDSHLEARGARQCHGRGIRKSFRLLLFHGFHLPVGASRKMWPRLCFFLPRTIRRTSTRSS
jgi:hypothetical protein